MRNIARGAALAASLGLSLLWPEMSARADAPQTQPATAPAPLSVKFDGEVSEAEAAACFQTGRFSVLHASDVEPLPPEQAQRVATYAFAAQTNFEGNDCLYVAFVCLDPKLSDLVVRYANDDIRVAQDDSVEFFIDIDGDRNEYHQLVVNAGGQFYALTCGRGRGFGGPRWDCGAKVKVNINRDAGNWSCEILIPLKSFPTLPRKGAKVPVNFCRNFRGQLNNPGVIQQTWSVFCGAGGNYHRPDLFGVMEWK